MQQIEHRVEEDEAGRTVAALLHDRGALSHRAAKGIIEAGLLTVDGDPVTDPATRVRKGQVVVARFDSQTRYAPRSRRREPAGSRWFRVLHEDADLLVVEKSPGILTVPAGAAKGHSLVERLLEIQPAANRSRGLWVVHRIDRHVSGLVVVARRAGALAALREQFAARTPLREYLALAEGSPPSPEGELRSWLAEERRTHKVFPTETGKGREAVLRYRVEERMRHASLVQIRLQTGRRNQIRVQLAEVGCPVVGDVAYGRPSPLIPRVALHATRLRFLHPRTGQPTEFRSELPADFLAAQVRLRRGARPAAGGAEGS